MSDSDLDAASLQSVYRWIDSIPLNKPKKNIARDFSDADKVLKKLGFQVTQQQIDDICACKKYAIERVLVVLQKKIGEYSESNKKATSPANGAGTGGFMDFGSPSSSSNNHHAAPWEDPYAGSGSTPYQQQQGASSRSNAYPSPGGQGQQHPQAGAVLSTDKDAVIGDLRETVEILQLKVQKLEQLLRLKNSKLSALQKKLDDQQMKQSGSGLGGLSGYPL